MRPRHILNASQPTYQRTTEPKHAIRLHRYPHKPQALRCIAFGHVAANTPTRAYHIAIASVATQPLAHHAPCTMHPPRARHMPKSDVLFAPPISTIPFFQLF